MARRTIVSPAPAAHLSVDRPSVRRSHAAAMAGGYCHGALDLALELGGNSGAHTSACLCGAVSGRIDHDAPGGTDTGRTGCRGDALCDRHRPDADVGAL